MTPIAPADTRFTLEAPLVPVALVVGAVLDVCEGLELDAVDRKLGEVDVADDADPELLAVVRALALALALPELAIATTSGETETIVVTTTVEPNCVRDSAHSACDPDIAQDMAAPPTLPSAYVRYASPGPSTKVAVPGRLGVIVPEAAPGPTAHVVLPSLPTPTSLTLRGPSPPRAGIYSEVLCAPASASRL